MTAAVAARGIGGALPGGVEPLELGRARTRTRSPAGMVVLLAVFAVVLWLLADAPPRLALGVGLGLALVLEGVVARRALAAPRVQVEVPPEAVAGETVPVVVTLHTAHHPIEVRSLWTWPCIQFAVDVAEPGVVPWPAGPRGLVTALHLELVATGPLGLVATTRRVRVRLPRPIVVAPAPVGHDLDLPALRTIRHGLTETSPTGHDLFRGVRPYQVGDPRRRVHWKATARTGDLMVRESDGSGLVALQVVLDLGDGGAEGEAAAARAAHVVTEAFHRGWFVRLVTAEDAAGPPPLPPLDAVEPGSPPPPPPPGDPVTVSSLVRSPHELRARLATACVGRPQPPRWRGPTRWIGAEGDRWG